MIELITGCTLANCSSASCKPEVRVVSLSLSFSASVFATEALAARGGFPMINLLFFCQYILVWTYDLTCVCSCLLFADLVTVACLFPSPHHT